MSEPTQLTEQDVETMAAQLKALSDTEVADLLLESSAAVTASPDSESADKAAALLWREGGERLKAATSAGRRAAKMLMAAVMEKGVSREQAKALLIAVFAADELAEKEAKR